MNYPLKSPFNAIGETAMSAPETATTPHHITDRVTLQEELEASMSAAGGLRFRLALQEARQGGRESETAYGSALISQSVVKVAQAIKDYIKKAKKGEPSSRSRPYLELVDYDVAAFMALKAVLDGITTKVRLQGVAMRIAGMLEDEVRFTHFENSEQTDPETGTKKSLKALFRVLKKNLEAQTSHYDHKRTVLIHSAGKAGVVWQNWPKSDKLHLGIKLIDIVIEQTHIAQVFMDVEKSKKNNSLVATEETLAWIDSKATSAELMCTLNQPMIIPPVDWTGPVGGGYLCRKRQKMKLVKTRNKAYLEELHSVDLGLVLNTVNGLQKTAWSINKDVYAAMAEAWSSNTILAGFPDQEKAPRPSKPLDIDTNPVAKKAWKRSVANVFREEIRVGSKRLQIHSIIQTAKKFLDEPAIYFPYNLDFRGRVYAIPSGLQPQGHDIAKGLLTFTNGKPLGDQQAADWLAIHGANLYGFDKVSLQDRVAWVTKNQEHILNSTKAPLDYTWWALADKPWQFLAFCFEWAGYVATGLGFVSHLPIALDGSCNGLQHFSAMLRDPIGGAATNLIPSETPKDIYQTVADKTIEKLKKSSDPLAALWLKFGITRKSVKRPVMVVPYGGTRHSSRNYILEHVKERLENREHNVFGTDRDVFMACSFLAEMVWDAISETVIAARDAMGWLQRVSQVVAQEEKPLNWTAPTGFPVQQAYPNVRKFTVKTLLAGSIVKLNLAEDATDDTELDRRRQASGISPNFVHSLDAAALMFTVDAAMACGIDSFGMVHDSYATTAADTDTLRECLRQSFCQMYQTDVLEAFRQEIQAGLPDGVVLPDLPKKGDLDINLVLQSDFFFA